MNYYNYKTIGTRKLVQRLKRLEKGDIISDKAFNPYANGITRFSIALWEVMKKHIDITGFTQAKMTYSIKNHYVLTLHHIKGFKIVLHGVSAGYYGEGSCACVQVLSECGFSYANRAYFEESFTLRKQSYTMPLKKYDVLMKMKNGYVHTRSFFARNSVKAVKMAQKTFPHVQALGVA